MNDINLFGDAIAPTLKTGKAGKSKTNPLIPVFGAGPDGKKCLGCKHQYFKVLGNTYSKCELRTLYKGRFNGASTDHNSRYLACGKFEPKPVTK